MVKLATIVALGAFILINIADCISGQDYEFTEDLDGNGNYFLSWKVIGNYIYFEMDANTTGYVALGISKTGGMFPADVALGYVDDSGQAHLGDFHTVGYQAPVLDSSPGNRDWVLDDGRQINGRTILRIHRLLDTCDTSGDLPITEDTMNIIYATHEWDPTSWDRLPRHQKRGSVSFQLLKRPKVRSSLPPNSMVRDFVKQDYQIPTNQSQSSRCFVFDLSNMRRKHHIIKAEAIYTSDTEQFIHQMYLYRCKMNNVPKRPGGFDCNDRAVRYCRSYVASFGYGVSEFNFPERVGLAIGGRGALNVYVLATYYDNPNNQVQIGDLDSSGIRLTYTATLQPVESAFLTVGNVVGNNWVQFIQPGQAEVKHTATCSKNCLLWGLRGPGRPMSVIGTIFHANSLGTKMKLRHLNEATSATYEKPWLAKDDNYLSNTRDFRALDRPRRIERNDVLSLECSYDSTGSMHPTYGGFSSQNELCRAYILYYPPKNIDTCMSLSTYNTIVNENNSPIHPRNVFEKLTSVDWASAAGTQMRDNLNTALETSSNDVHCWSPSHSRNKYAVDLGMKTPKPDAPFIPPAKCNR